MHRMNANIALILTALPVLILICAAWGDLQRRTIEHWIVISLAVMAPFFWWAAGIELLPDFASGQHPWLQLASLFSPASVVTIVVLAFAMLFFFTLFFAIGWMGGGDVKLLASLSLWLMPWELPKLLVVEALAGVVVTLLAWGHHRITRNEGPVEVPRGIAIAFAGVCVLVERYLNQFG